MNYSSVRADQRNKKAGGYLQSFQSALKKFYLYVHPDLFTDNLEAQKLNDDNFKKLTQYLDNYRAGVEKNEVYDVEFYSKHAGDELKLIKARLELPSKHSSIETLEAVFKKNVGKLFSQCNIDEFDVSGYGLSGRVLRSATKNEISLINMIISAHTRLKRGANLNSEVDTSKKDIQESTKLIQAEIRKKVPLKFVLEVPNIAFKTALSKYTSIKGWFKRLQSCIDSLDASALESLKDRKIVFSYHKHGITTVGGPIYLEINESMSMWFETLSKSDKASEEKFLADLEKAQNLEKSLKLKLKVASLSSDYKVLLGSLEDYIAKLQEIHEAIVRSPSDWAFPLNCSTTHVIFTTNVSGVCREDPRSCSIYLNYTNPMEQIPEIIKTASPRVLVASRNLNMALTTILKHYQCASITVAPQLENDPDTYFEGLTRLLDGRYRLEQYLYRSELNICVSDGYSFNDEAKILFIDSKFLF